MKILRVASFLGIILGGTACITAYVKREQSGRHLEVVRARLIGVDAASGNFIIRRSGRPMGVSKLAFDTNEDTVEIREDTQLWVPVPGGQVQEARQVATTFLDRTLEVIRFEILIEAVGGGNKAQRSIVKGRRISKDSMLVQVSSGGQIQEAKMKVPEGMAIGQSLWPRLAISGTLLVGSSFQTYEFDPLSLTARRQNIEITKVDSALRTSFADTYALDKRAGYMKVYTIEQKSNGLLYKVKVRQDGMPITTTLPAGLVVELSTPEDVGRLMGQMQSGKKPKELAKEADDATLIGASAIRAGVPTVGNNLIGAMKVVLGGMPPENDLNGGVQKVQGDTVWVQQGNLDIGLQRDTSSRYIQPEPFIESNEPEIKKMALSITEGAKSDADKTKRVTHWVWKNLSKVYTASFSSALQVLRAKAGDCTEHTALTTAMLRSLNIPAREVTGLAYVRGSWFYHAWVEVDLGQGWQPVDPTFDEIPASAGRLRLFVGRGGITQVLQLVDRLQMNVLEARAATGLNSIATPTDAAGRR